MNEKTYRVIEVTTNQVLAKGMTFEIAIAFIKGYSVTFYNEPLSLIIAEEERS